MSEFPFARKRDVCLLLVWAAASACGSPPRTIEPIALPEDKSVPAAAAPVKAGGAEDAPPAETTDWAGKYEFGECFDVTIGSTGQKPCWFYTAIVTGPPKDGRYAADVSISGYQTYRHYLATGVAKGGALRLLFAKVVDDSMLTDPLPKDELLFTIARTGKGKTVLKFDGAIESHLGDKEIKSQ